MRYVNVNANKARLFQKLMSIADSVRPPPNSAKPLESSGLETWPEADSAGDPLSFTATVNVEVPLAVGVPEIAPALDRVKPAGRLPEARDHV